MIIISNICNFVLISKSYIGPKMANKALVIPFKGASLELQTRGIPTPGSDQVVVRNHAVAINFIDNLQRNFGFKVPLYPIVIGADVSGVVDIPSP